MEAVAISHSIRQHQGLNTNGLNTTSQVGTHQTTIQFERSNHANPCACDTGSYGWGVTYGVLHTASWPCWRRSSSSSTALAARIAACAATAAGSARTPKVEKRKVKATLLNASTNVQALYHATQVRNTCYLTLNAKVEVSHPRGCEHSPRCGRRAPCRWLVGNFQLTHRHINYYGQLKKCRRMPSYNFP